MSWHDLVRVFERAGFQLQRIHGDHMAYTKPGVRRPVIIPRHREISVGLIESNLRTAAISREQFLLLAG
jgi:predicted RNA binding protein YcfA (HicA-like mRNA interferase family)